ncbi:MAG: hypothetical protein SNJ57_09230 [Cyanobacteriota bacterium]
MPSKNVQFRNGEIEAILAEIDPSPGQAASWVLEALLLYSTPEVLKALSFTAEEAVALFRDLSGWRMSPDTLHLMWANIEDPALAAKIKELGMAEVLAIAIAVRRVGAGRYSLALGELESELKRVGLLQ